MTRFDIPLLALAGLACLPRPLPSENVEHVGKPRVVSLRVASSSETRSPAFALGLSLTLENARVVWSGGLLTYEKSGTPNPIIHVFDQDGRDNPGLVSIPNAAVVNIEDMAHSEDGTLAACGYALDSAGHRSGLVYRISPDRQSAKAIRMSGLYLPNLISLAPDGSIWVKGWEPGEIAGRSINYDASVIRRFDKDGKLQGAYLSQRRVLSSVPTNRLTSVPGFLVSTSSRVCWHQSFAPAVYYEFFPDGTTVEYPSVPMAAHEFLIGFAITEGGDVFAATTVGNHSEKPSGFYLYTLDRKAREWAIVELPKGSDLQDLRHLIGAQGNALVFNTKKPGVSRILTLK